MELHLPTTLVLPFFVVYLGCVAMYKICSTYLSVRALPQDGVSIGNSVDVHYLSNSVVGLLDRLPELIHENTAMRRSAPRYRIFSSKTVVSAFI